MTWRAGAVQIVGLLLAATQSHPALAQTDAPPKTCVQVQIGSDKTGALNCLNQQLQQQAQSAGQAAPPALPLGAGSPSNAVGTFNEAGVKEQYGQNFGKSVIPYRPPPPVFSNGVP